MVTLAAKSQQCWQLHRCLAWVSAASQRQVYNFLNTVMLILRKGKPIERWGRKASGLMIRENRWQRGCRDGDGWNKNPQGPSLVNFLQLWVPQVERSAFTHRISLAAEKRRAGRTMTQLRTLIAMGAALLTSGAALANDIHGYPRLAGVNMGGPHNYDDPAYQAKLAKLDMSVLNMWPGWEKSRDMTMDQVVRNIKAINPKSKVFLYHISMEVSDDNASTASYRDYVDRNKWWAYPTNLSGSRILSSFGAREDKPVHVINTTLHTSKDSNGY